MSRRPGRATVASSWRSSDGTGPNASQCAMAAACPPAHPVSANYPRIQAMETADVLLIENMWLGSFIGLRGNNMAWLKATSGANHIDQRQSPSRVVIRARSREQAAHAVSLVQHQLTSKCARGKTFAHVHRLLHARLRTCVNAYTCASAGLHAVKCTLVSNMTGYDGGVFDMWRTSGQNSGWSG